MEGGALFNSGYLGSQWQWWIGQIADDATWRDNTLSGKFQDKDTSSGWGRRYKVRIMGIHDQGEDEIPSDQLPWANIMYPVTAGGGQTGAYHTPALRQGNVVFGFWMDGPEQEIPVIMGILGNNPQTPLATKQSDSRVTNTKPGSLGTSGYAEGKLPPKGKAKPQVPDKDLVTSKPKTPAQQQECASPPPGMKLNKYGLRPDRPQSAQQFADAAAAKALAEADTTLSALDPRLKKIAIDERVKEAVAKGRQDRCAAANSPLGAAAPGASIESGATSPHIIPAADIKKSDVYRAKVVLLKPDKPVVSATKAIQTSVDNLTVKIQKYLSSIMSYSDAVSNPIPNIQKEVEFTSIEMSKHMKTIYDKVMEYSVKTLNSELTTTVSNLPSSKRFQYADVKEGFTTKLLEEYNGITNNLASTMLGVLNQQLDMKSAEDKARKKAASIGIGATTNFHPEVPMCYAEQLVGEALAADRENISRANDNMINNINLFLTDVEDELAGSPGGDTLGAMKNMIGTITGSMVSALNFENLVTNVFPFELPPNEAVSDFYTFAKGGAAQADSMTPSMSSIAKTAAKDPIGTLAKAKVPFSQPSKDKASIDLTDKSTIETQLEGGLMDSKEYAAIANNDE